MRAPALIILVLLAGIYSCNSGDTASGPTGGEQLRTDTFSIDPTKDTVLNTPEGARIKIGAGTFDAGDATTVSLEVKEAVTPEDSRKGSLSLTSGDTTLNSSGIIFVNLTPGQHVTIQKSFSISIPARNPGKDVKLYKGRLDENGIVNWGVPEALASPPLSDGKTIYETNCASCHHLKGNATAPSLAFLSVRRDQRWLYAVTRRNDLLLWRGDPYVCFLFNRYKKSSMPAFPNMSDGDLRAVYQYVTSASKAVGLDASAVADLKPGYDSCAAHDTQCGEVINNKSRNQSSADSGAVASSAASVPITDYYTFSVDKHGWYNVAAGGEEKATVDSSSVGSGEMLEALQACPCACNVEAYRKTDSIAKPNRVK